MRPQTLRDVWHKAERQLVSDQPFHQVRISSVMGAWVRAHPPQPRKLQRGYCVRLSMDVCIADRASCALALRVGALTSGQWRAMADGIDGIHGIGGNVVSVTYRF